MADDDKNLDAQADKALMDMANASLNILSGRETDQGDKTQKPDTQTQKPTVDPNAVPDEDNDVPYKDPKDIKNFKAQRQVIKQLSETNKATLEQMKNLQKELDDLKKNATKPADKKEDPPVDLMAKLDPKVKEWADKNGLTPILEAANNSAKELKAAKEVLAKYEQDKKDADSYQDQISSFNTMFGDWSKDNGVSQEDQKAIMEIVASGKVGGKTFGDVFDNAREYLELKRGGSNKSQDDIRAEAERIAAGGSPGTPPAPKASGREGLMKQFSELEKTDPKAADLALIEALSRPSDLGRRHPALRR